MRMSDAISAYILEMLKEADGGAAELRRNELAEEIGCVPSQINYVLSSRFTPEQGYLVESRRGGGGYIRIQRIPFRTTVSQMTHIVNAIGDKLDAATAEVILQNLTAQGLLSLSAARLMGSVLSDRAYRDVPVALRDRLRATLMKQLLTTASMME